MPSMNRDQFLKEYVLRFDKEFEYDGVKADWAPSTSGSPLLWGEEQSALELVQDDPSKNPVPSASIAMTPDDRFMAVATHSAIRIYTVDTKQLVANFFGQAGGVGQLFFMPDTSKRPSGAQYTLLAGGQHVGDDTKGVVIAWQLDSTGKPLGGSVMPFAVDHFADRAIGAIEVDLSVHHDLSAEEKQTLRTAFASALRNADHANRTREQITWPGEFPTFNPIIASCDGSAWLHLEHNRSTQQGMRPPKELPQIVIHFSTDSKIDDLRLSGHTDAIMWAAWSPTDPDVLASASWDGTFMIWNLSKQEGNHVVGPTGRQNWTGAFSPDGQHVLLSGTSNVGLYHVSTGELTYRLERPGLAAWVRHLAWSPAGDAIALASSGSVILWEPFVQKQTEILKLAKDKNALINLFANLVSVKWLGERIVVETSENTVCVWDRERNWKWRFQRPQGTMLGFWRSDALVVGERVVTLDGDWRVREWKL